MKTKETEKPHLDEELEIASMDCRVCDASPAAELEDVLEGGYRKSL